MLAALAIGAAYSVPPARLKRFPVVASLCVSGVRSAIVNLGVAAHFTSALGSDGATIPPGVWALTAFVLPFSLAIAILKDVPDAEGDRAHRIATFTVRHGGRARDARRPRRAHARLPRDGRARPAADRRGRSGRCSSPATSARSRPCWIAARGADPADNERFTRFYMRVWLLFFLEYAIVPVSCLAG